jgi:hypothetical protein
MMRCSVERQNFAGQFFSRRVTESFYELALLLVAESNTSQLIAASSTE